MKTKFAVKKIKALFFLIPTLILIGFAPLFLQPGLTNAEPIGGFLNGNFPNSLNSEIFLETAFSQSSNFSAILASTAEPNSTRLHFGQRAGQFYWLSSDSEGGDKTLFMDISDRVWTGQDSGVLGMAFHPDFNQPSSINRNFFYVYYVTSFGGDEYIRLSRFTRDEGSGAGNPNSESVLIEQVLGPTLHRGGGLLFGFDGFLYLSIGDLGWQEQSQNITDRFSGGILRIDVDKKGGNISHPVRRTLQNVGQGTSGDYYIPNDNPFLSENGDLFEEYYALGSRNPHRMTLDKLTGGIYIGNVGSNTGVVYEEINVLEKGANYGWPYREGSIDRPDLMNRPTEIIGTERDPIHEYDHSGGNSYVVGGYVYRGNAIPELNGKYIFGDGGSRKIWALDLTGQPPFNQKEEILSSNQTFYSFSEDTSGELYLTSNRVQKINSTRIVNSDFTAGTYFIRARHSGKYLDVSTVSQNNGATIYQWAFTGAQNQQWAVNVSDSGSYTLTAVHSGKVLDVQAFGTTDGSNVHQWTLNNTANQKWFIEPVEGTFFRIKGLQSNLDLEVAEISNANGVNVQIGIREATNNFNQMWEFIPASGGGPINASGGMPSLLSETGAFKNLETLEPSNGVLPYDMIASFWSDGAEKYRWFALPNDGVHNSNEELIEWSEEGDWKFPIGTVFIKHFEILTDKNDPNSTKRLETRFFIHGDEGYYALTYKWLPDGSDAELLDSSFEENFTITEIDGTSIQQKWYYPSQSECFICHTEASGRVLGPKTSHLNRDILYPKTGVIGNQVETYNHLGMFDQNLNPSDIPNYLTASEIDDESASIEDRARSYLDINCSSCHRPNSGLRSNWNALLSEILEETNMINGEVIEDLGIEGAKIIVPGDTAKSVLYQRIKQVNTSAAMPPLAKNLVDEVGVALIAEWIEFLGITNATGISLNTSSLSLIVGESGTLISTISPSDASNQGVSWSSSDENIATVDTNGNVTAISTGEATITVTTNDGGFEASTTVEVIAATISVTGISLNTSSFNLTAGESATLRATVSPSDASNQGVTWSSSDDTIATVDNNGNVTANAPGTATITATTDDGGYEANATVNVTISTIGVTGVTLEPESFSIAVGETTVLNAQVIPSNANNTALIWYTSDASVASISDTGEVTALSEGTSVFTARTVDGGFEAYSSVTVFAGSQGISVTGVTLEPESFSIAVGETTVLNAGVIPSNADNTDLIWYTSDASVASISDTGEVTALSEGTSVFTARTVDGGFEAYSSVTVFAGSQGISVTGVTLEPESLSMSIGEIVTLNAQVIPSNADNTSLIWYTSNASVASISSTGEVTALSEGTSILTARTVDGGFEAYSLVNVFAGGQGISVTGVTLEPELLTIAIGETIRLSAGVIPSNADNTDLIWYTSDSSVASISSSGDLTALSEGVTVITARTVDGGFEAYSTVTSVEAESGALGVVIGELAEQDAVISNLSVAPNPIPSNSDFAVSFVAFKSEQFTIELWDYTGRLIKREIRTARIGWNLVDLESLNYAAGNYIVTVKILDDMLAKQLIVK